MINQWKNNIDFLSEVNNISLNAHGRAALHASSGDGSNVLLLHVALQLFGDFFEYLLCEVTLHFRFPERHELHDVSHSNQASAVPQLVFVGVEVFHSVEVCVTNTNDND